MKILNFKNRIKLIDKSKNYSISVSGGLGAQIYSIAIYRHYKNQGINVSLDLSYFDKKFNNVNNNNWPWALDYYGYNINDFKPEIKNYKKIIDSEFKFSEAINALSQDDAQSWFKFSELDLKNLKLKHGDFTNKNSAVIHIRRGDFLKINAFILNNNYIYATLERFSGIYEKLYIITDSDIKQNINFIEEIKLLFSEVIILDSQNLSDIESHIIMRNAHNLFAANSQFSISAALLNRNKGVIFLPRRIVYANNCPFGNILMNNNINKSFFY